MSGARPCTKRRACGSSTCGASVLSRLHGGPCAQLRLSTVHAGPCAACEMRSLWRLLLAAAGTLSFRQHLPVPCASLALQPSAVWHVMAGQRGRVHFLASAYSSIKPFDAPMIPMMSCERDRNEHLPCSSIWPFSSLNGLVLATGQVNTSAMQPKTGWAAPFVFHSESKPQKAAGRAHKHASNVS